MGSSLCSKSKGYQNGKQVLNKNCKSGINEDDQHNQAIILISNYRQSKTVRKMQKLDRNVQ